MDPSHSFEGEQDRVLVNAALNWLNKLIPWSLGIPVFFLEKTVFFPGKKPGWSMDFWGMPADWGLASGWFRGEGERDCGGQSCRIIWSNQEQKAWRIVWGLLTKKRRNGKFEIGPRGVEKAQDTFEDMEFCFQTEISRGDGENSSWRFLRLPGASALISVGNVKQSRPTPEQLTQNQPLTPAVWSICNSSLGIAMKTTFCSGCLQEFI